MTNDSTYLYARLPRLGAPEPPPECPICKSRRIPPESDDGLPPPEQWVYTCNGAYILPDGDDNEPNRWQPYDFCGQLRASQALAWIREMARSRTDLSAAASVLERAVREPPPYPLTEESPLLLWLPSLSGERAPLACPVCGASQASASPGFQHYACGSGYWATSTQPGPSGAQVPMSWGSYSPCPKPPINTLLSAVRARNEDPWSAVCGEALAAIALRQGNGVYVHKGDYVQVKGTP